LDNPSNLDKSWLFMPKPVNRHLPRLIMTVATIGGTCAAGAMAAAPSYQPIVSTLAGTTVVLTGTSLTIDELLQIARHGAKAQLSASAKQRQSDNYGLLLEAQAEGVPVYSLNRGGGLARQETILVGDPLSADNKALLERRQLAAFEEGALYGDGPEISNEEIVRATMTIRANQMVQETPSPALSQMLLDLLNNDITPVMQSRGTVGESDWNLIPNIGGVMVGKGEAYYHGIRMTAAQALQRAGLAPLKPFAIDNSTLSNSNGYSTALAALLLVNGGQALDWTDLTQAVDLNGMNSSVTPLSAPAQLTRPFKWLNWDAARVLDMLKGSYLFNSDPQRILADADSLRASSIRQGAAWQAWAALRDDVIVQMNSSDHNPAVMVGLSPEESWELSTPQMMKYYVKGGRYSSGKHGYIVTTANWDPYPMVNDIEAFTNALANVAVAVSQRTYRFDNAFFTVIKPSDVLAGDGHEFAPPGNPTLTANLWQELQVLASPVPAEGISTDSQSNGDIQSQASIKASRGLEAVDVMMHLLGQDLLTGTYWMNLRVTQDPSRSFGKAPDALLVKFREVIPWQSTAQRRSGGPPAMVAYEFIRDTPITQFYPNHIAEPAGPALGSHAQTLQ
jgi:histidine ammonia-lyase